MGGGPKKRVKLGFGAQDLLLSKAVKTYRPGEGNRWGIGEGNVCWLTKVRLKRCVQSQSVDARGGTGALARRIL